MFCKLHILFLIDPVLVSDRAHLTLALLGAEDGFKLPYLELDSFARVKARFYSSDHVAELVVRTLFTAGAIV